MIVERFAPTDPPSHAVVFAFHLVAEGEVRASHALPLLPASVDAGFLVAENHKPALDLVEDVGVARMGNE